MLSSFFDITSIKYIISSVSSALPESLAVFSLMAIGIVIMNAFLLAIFGLVGAAFLRRMRIASGDLEQQKQQAHEKAEVLLENARKESLRLVGEAGKKAGEILAQTEAVKESLETQLTHAFQEFSQKENERLVRTAQDFVVAYHEMFESSKQEYSDTASAVTKEMAADAKRSIEQFQEFLKNQTIHYEGALKQQAQEYSDTASAVTKEMAADGKRSIEQFQEFLKNQTTHYEGALKQQAQEGFMSAQKEISDYKRESLRHVEDAIYRILNLVAKSVLGKVLSLEDKQDLIINALNEAKQQGFFEV